MNDQLLAWIRFSVASLIGASLNAALNQIEIIDPAMIAEFSSAIQSIVTVIAYVLITLAAVRWPVINRVLSLFLSSQPPKYK
jgi:uncharacterized membrane protein YidH (DUF202 family)